MRDLESENLHVAPLLERAARETPPRPDLPSASQLWWRARIIRDLTAKEQVVERATRSSRWVQGAGLALLCLLAALGLTWLSADALSGLRAEAAGNGAPWNLLAGLLFAGTVVPLAGFTALWLIWRDI